MPDQLGVRPSEVRWLALLTSALWLLHPLHVSTVLYAVQRMAQLSTLFTLAGLYVFARYRSRWAVAGASPGDVLACLLWLFLFTLLAAFSKENGVLLPWLVVVCEMFVYRGQWAGAVRLPLTEFSSGWDDYPWPWSITPWFEGRRRRSGLSQYG